MAGLYKISLLDDSPGFEFVKNLAAPYTGFARHVSLSTVDIETGEVWNLVDAMESAEADLTNRIVMNFEDLNKYAIASGSVPTAFPPTIIDGHMFVDGMTAYNLNAQEAIDRCRDLGYEDNQIVIDMLVCKVTKDLNQWDSGFNSY